MAKETNGKPGPLTSAKLSKLPELGRCDSCDLVILC